MAIFRTLESSLSFEDWKNELVFVFGNADADKRIPDQYLFRIPNSKFVNPKKFCSTIDPKLWGNGFTFIADATVGRKDGLALQTVQMNLIKAYYSYHFKNTTPYTPPAVITALQGGLTDPTRSLNQLKNMPWLLRYPLADKICKKNIGLPVLIVMPGHSVIKVQSDIKRLAQKCLVICIARSLKICLAAGVEPDFVVQYDTHLEQRHFYETIPLLKNTVLVSLSSASISGYAWKFRGVVFRASFNQLILSNDFVMRDGSEGSLLACLGLAEALRAPMVCMAGCDFSWKPHQDIYDPNEAAQHETNSHTEDYRITPEVLRSEYLMPGRFRVVNRDGQVVCSTIGYVAAAAKASEFADDIQTLVGTKFYLLSHDGILHPNKFPLLHKDAFAATPVINREAYLTTIDEVLNAKEQLNWDSATAYFKELGHFLQQQELHFQIKKWDPKFNFEFEDSFVSLLKNIRSFILSLGADREQAQRMISVWSQAYRHASKITLAYRRSTKNPIPVICAASERIDLEQKIDGYFPRNSLVFWEVTNFADKSATLHELTLQDTNLAKWLRDSEIVFVSAGMAKKYSYVFELMADDNLIFLPDFACPESLAEKQPEAPAFRPALP